MLTKRFLRKATGRQCLASDGLQQKPALLTQAWSGRPLPQNRVSGVSDLPSFLAQRAMRTRQPSQLTARDTSYQENGQGEGSPVEQSTSKDSMSGPAAKQAVSPETRPSKVPVLPSFRAKYIMDLQRSIQKPPREAVSENSGGAEEPGRLELPVPDNGVADPIADEMAPSEAPAPQAPKPPSFLAQRETARPRIVEALPRETMSEEGARAEVPPAERPVLEDSAADSSTDQAVPSGNPCAAGPHPTTAVCEGRNVAPAVPVALPGFA